MRKVPKASVSSLDHKAEEQLVQQPFMANPGDYSEAELIRMIQELYSTLEKNENRYNDNLLQSDDRYYSLFHTNPTIMLLIDPDSGEIKDANMAACHYYGWSHSLICTMFIRQINLLSDEEIKFEMQLAKDEKRNYFNFRHRLASGDIRDVEVYSGPINIFNSTLLYSNIHDITERRRTEIALQESETKFRSIIQSQAEGIGIVDKDEIFEFVNQAADRIFETEPGELIGASLFDFLTEHEREKVKNQTLSRKNGGINKYDLEIITKKGNTRFIHVSATPKLDSSDNYLGAYGVFQDITEQKQVEKTVKDKSVLLTNLIVNLQEGILLEDSNRKIVLTNQLFCDMFAIPAPPEALTGSDCSDSAEQSKNFFKDPEKFVENILSILADRKTVLNDELELADGRFLDRDYIPTYTDLHYTGHLWKYKDVTERKQSELILNIRLRLTEFSFTHSQSELQQKLLDELEQLTNSHIGFFHGVDADQKTLLLQCWSTNTLKHMCTAESKGAHYGIDKAGVWVDCVRARKAIVHNDYIHLPYRNGLPVGHAQVVRELVVPVFRNDQIVAIIGIGNKPGDYHERDVEIVSLIADLAWDIIERKGAEEGLKKLSQAVEQSPAMTYITDPSGMIEYVNTKVNTLTGYSQEELIGQNPRIFSSGEKPKPEYDLLWQTIASGKEWKGEFHNKKKNGEFFWVAATISPVIDSGGKLTHYLAVEEDITARKQSEEKIVQQNDRLNAIISAIPDLIFVLDQHGNNLEYYTNTPDQLLLPEDQIVGTNRITLFDQDTSNLHILKINECIFEKKLVTYEYYESSQNFSNYYEVRLVPFGNAKVLAFVRDITRRKQTETEIKDLNTNLELKIAKRTAQLSETNENLQQEIVERTKVAAALEEALKRLHKIADRVPGVVYQYLLKPDGTSCFPFASEGMYEVFRVKPEEITFDASILFTRIHPDDLSGVVTSIQESANDLTLWWHEFRVKFEDGSMRWLQGNGMPQLEEDGSVIWYGFISDATESKLIEGELEESREKYKGLSEATFEAIFISEKGICIEQNLAAEKMFGYTSDEAYVRYGTDWIAPEDREKVRNNMLAGFEEPYEVLALKKDGSTFPCVLRGKMMHYKGRNVRVTSLTDITARILAEEALHWNQSLLQLMSNSSPLGFLVVDNRSDDILYFNQRFCHIWGIEHLADRMKSEKMKNNDIIPYCLPVLADVPAFAESCKPLQDESNRIVLSDEIQFSENRTIHRYSTQIRGENDKYYGRFYIFEEITQSKMIEEEIKRARFEAEHANMAKSEFLSRMSHELRTPMNSILGFAQLLEMSELNASQQKGVGHILRSGKLLLDLINEVLDISRIEAGHILLSLVPVQLNKIIPEMMDTVQLLAKARNVKVEFEVIPGDEMFVSADLQRLRQVLLNLLNNAIKYNHFGGSIKIWVSVAPGNLDDADAVMISIKDSGPGISREDIPRLFRSFERIGAEKTQTEGTGLGLSVVKKLTEAMGGKVGVESVEGEGSTFWIVLPQGQTQSESFENHGDRLNAEPPLTVRKASVLYIEDNASNIELVEQILTSQRSNILLVSDRKGKQAVPLAIEYQPDLILLDLNLPDMAGGEVIRNLRSEEKTRAIPIVIVSADAMPLNPQKYLSDGVKDYLTKPLNINLFLKVIDQFIRN